MTERAVSPGDANNISPLSSMVAGSSSLDSGSESLRVTTSGQLNGVYSHMPIHSGNLSKFPLATLPNSSSPKSGPLKLGVFSFMGRRRKKLPTTHDLGQALDKLNKQSKKTLKQQQAVLNLFKDWGTGLPDSASRELVMNLFNMLLGPLSISKDLSAKLSAIGSQLDELSLLEDHRSHLESELVNTQKLFHRASYKGYPNYQLQSYQVSYDTFRNDFDEITLRYRNKLVMVLKQALHSICASMHDQGESELECASMGFRILAAFDSEPKHVVQSSIYQPMQYYTPLLAPANEEAPSPSIHEDKTCVQCHLALTETPQPEVVPRNDIKCKTSNEPADERNVKRVPLSPGEARFAKLSPRLSLNLSNNISIDSLGADGNENTLGNRQQSLSQGFFLNRQSGTANASKSRFGLFSRSQSNESVISPNPFT